MIGWKARYLESSMYDIVCTEKNQNYRYLSKVLFLGRWEAAGIHDPC